jgi:hypothetical protein
MMQALRQKFGTLILQTYAWVILSNEAKRVTKTNSEALTELRYNKTRVRRPEPCGWSWHITHQALAVNGIGVIAMKSAATPNESIGLPHRVLFDNAIARRG